jgi:hypothetical protein
LRFKVDPGKQFVRPYLEKTHHTSRVAQGVDQVQAPLLKKKKFNTKKGLVK